MNLSLLQQTPVFTGSTEEEIEKILPCLEAHERHFSKGALVYQMGDHIDSLGIVLSGGVRVERNDIWGNQRILDYLAAGQVFAEVYACVPQEALMVDVVTTEKSEILFLKAGKVLGPCGQACPFHQRLLQNLLRVLASKNLTLTRKISHITPRSIRERLISYLSAEAVRQKAKDFDIPFNRQELADYLSVDRSALSAELSKMQKEGLLVCRKNHFILETNPEYDL